MVHRQLTMLEAVAMAVRSEIESTDLYENLVPRVRNPAVQDLLRGLAEDEQAHRSSLTALYERLLEGQEPSLPTSDGRKKQWDIDPQADFLTIMTKARDKEYDSEAFYKSAAERVQDYKTRMFFLDLAETERRHAVVLQEQVERLQADPHWFEREDAYHEGP